MAFKIKDLMINIAPSEAGEGTANCVAGKKSDVGCVGGKKSDVGCVGGKKSDVGCVGGKKSDTGAVPAPEGRGLYCPGRRTDIACGPVFTDVGGCQGTYTYVGCQGNRTDMGGCPGRHTDVVICVAANTDIAFCVGRLTNIGHCARCTVKSPKGGLSPVCDPGEMLEELNIIKAQLQAELTSVDDQIREIEDTLQPKTIGEVEELQTRLQEALVELGKMKADMGKK